MALHSVQWRIYGGPIAECHICHVFLLHIHNGVIGSAPAQKVNVLNLGASPESRFKNIAHKNITLAEKTVRAMGCFPGDLILYATPVAEGISGGDGKFFTNYVMP